MLSCSKGSTDAPDLSQVPVVTVGDKTLYMDELNNTVPRTPVSYTHLDVYKRQGQEVMKLMLRPQKYP